MKLRLLYFASLADAAGCSEESFETCATTPRDAYGEARERHGFRFDTDTLRVAVNGAFADWNRALADGDEVVFIPPVSGG